MKSFRKHHRRHRAKALWHSLRKNFKKRELARKIEVTKMPPRIQGSSVGRSLSRDFLSIYKKEGSSSGLGFAISIMGGGRFLLR